MVKNTHGGNKHKKFARKRDESGRNTINNLKKTPGQEYGFITKVLGNCKFNITCYDNNSCLLAVIMECNGQPFRICL